MVNGRPVFLCANVRSPIGRYGGALSVIRPDDLAAHVIKGVLAQVPDLDPVAIDEVVLGCANQAGEDNRNVARMAALLAGLPEHVPGVTVNRLCASGLDAVATGARAIATGEADIVIAGGVESMSRAPFVVPKAREAWQRTSEIHDTTIGWRFVNARMHGQYGTDSMPETAENVAEKYGVSREDQDAFALRSQQKTEAARQRGIFHEEILPIDVPARRGAFTSVTDDEHPRPQTDLTTLAKLATPFRANGTVTAGNASGVNDGAAAMILADDGSIARHNLTPLARICGFASAGVAPALMGIGPVDATHKLCARLGLATEDFDIIELNEAFASQAIAVLRELGVPDDADHVNPNGGAIALGHPLGMSGARLAMTAARELGRRSASRALVTMCVGVGQGAAMALEAV